MWQYLNIKKNLNAPRASRKMMMRTRRYKKLNQIKMIAFEKHEATGIKSLFISPSLSLTFSNHYENPSVGYHYSFVDMSKGRVESNLNNNVFKSSTN